MNNEQWDAEVKYCIDLCRNKGGISVPFISVANYFDTQARQADRDHAFKLAKAFDDAANFWRQGMFSAAENTLRVVWERGDTKS